MVNENGENDVEREDEIEIYGSYWEEYLDSLEHIER